MRPQGLVTVERIVDSTGKVVPVEKAIKYGWLERGAERSTNLFVDQGRQLLVYAFAFRAPIENYVCRKYGIGSGQRPAKTTDIALQAPIDLGGSTYTAAIDSIDFLSAFTMRVSFTIPLAINGVMIYEMGLFSGNDALIARRVRTVGINKTSDFSPTLVWRLRF